MIEDLWPHLTSFEEVLEHIEQLMQEDSDELEAETTGSEHRMEAIAERARIAEEKAARRLARLKAKEERETVKVRSEHLEDHEWLVE